MYFLDAEEARLEGFRQEWESLGDSIVVVGGDGTWNCHIHTDDIGGAIESGISAGRPHDIRITDLHEQSGDRAIHDHSGELQFEPRPEAAVARVGVVAVVRGHGLLEIFRGLGVQGVVTGGQTMNPSTEDLLAVVDSVPADEIIVLPNNKNIVPVAEQLDALSNKTVRVVPTRSIQQGISAMFGYSPSADSTAVEAAEDMAAAASSVVDGAITQAVRAARVEMGKIRSGDWLGIADGTIVVNDVDLEAALRGLVAAILPPLAELLTIYTGEGSRRSVTKALVAWLSELHPEIRVMEIEGGQPLYPYLISIE
jgi:dihydroxyacetone kinase-like predicted kinase